MVNITHHIPKSLDEALTILSNNDCYIVSGGTDIMVSKHRRSGLLPNFDKDIIYISHIKDVAYINKDELGNIHIGACAKYSDILISEIIPDILKDIVKEIASPNIRNMATMVGNIANASPAGDSLVGLYLLNAKVELASKNGNRIVDIKDFIIGVRKTILRKDELIKEIIIPKYDLDKLYFKKVGSRAAESISKVTFAGAFKIKESKLIDLRISFGSVGTTIVRKKDIENKYIGSKIEDFKTKIPLIVDDFCSYINPISDQRSTKEYRYKVARNILRKFLNDIGE